MACPAKVIAHDRIYALAYIRVLYDKSYKTLRGKVHTPFFNNGNDGVEDRGGYPVFFEVCL